ncbi:hypothetical protein C7212DRAFT_338608, partial [Tuber magnatum]
MTTTPSIPLSKTPGYNRGSPKFTPRPNIQFTTDWSNLNNPACPAYRPISGDCAFGRVV